MTQIQVIAHRGASRAERENTLAAFRRAAVMGANAVELDVRRTSDGAMAVHHDAVLPDGRVICEMTSAELPEHVPLLPAALDACNGMWVNIEIKNPIFKFYKTSISNVQFEQILLVFKDFTEVQKSQIIRSDFIANASHNLKTPLVSLKGFLETIEDSAKDDPRSQKKFIEIMKLEASKMEILIEDLMTLSRIEQQEHISINNKVNIKKIIEDVIILTSKRIKEKQISLKVDLDNNQQFVIGDAEKLSTLFLNLIDNAIKFSNPLKTIEIKILKVDEIFKKFISISIIDEGIGINEEDIHRITERFFRAENTRKLKIEGTGLGLAIVKHIINQHRGELKITSKIGLGSEFIIRLPKA